MKILGIACAILLHVGFISFGRALFHTDENDQGSLQQVELLTDEEVKADEKPLEPPPDKNDELEAEAEQPPDASELIRSLDVAPAVDAPALDAASLSAIEAALNGQTGIGGDFSQSLDFSSGGRIGGTGKGGALDEKLEQAFSLAEIDQKPRPVFQAAPVYPAALRGKRLEGVVSVLFVVDQAGKVVNPRVEKSNHPEFEKPAVDAVRKWKFEPAIKAGQRVACKMRVPIRFQPS